MRKSVWLSALARLVPNAPMGHFWLAVLPFAVVSLLHGNMLCGVEVGRFMFRVGPAQEAEALARPGARPIDITGKPMKGFVWVDAREADGAGLEGWIELAVRFVGALPPK